MTINTQEKITMSTLMRVGAIVIKIEAMVALASAFSNFYAIDE